jgi:hypothetical protein
MPNSRLPSDLTSIFMKKILKPGIVKPPPPLKTQCEYCDCIFEYEFSDVSFFKTLKESYPIVGCPQKGCGTYTRIMPVVEQTPPTRM